MRLTIFNGSPRRKKSNTRLLLEEFAGGFRETSGNTVEVHYICIEKDMNRLLDAYKRADTVLIAFPLYCDCMPARVNEFFSRLSKFRNDSDNPSMLFLVQSGFPEANHSRYVERYLGKLTRRLGADYMGCMVKGGVEGIQNMPKFMAQKTFKSFFAIGKQFGKTTQMSNESLKKLAGPENFTGFGVLILRLLKALGITNLGWRKHLKDNDALHQRDHAPYAESAAH